MRGRTGTVLLLTLAAACNGRPPDVYPPDVVENFMRSCTARSAERNCRCALDELERRFSIDEFRALEARTTRGEIPKEMVDAVAACR